MPRLHAGVRTSRLPLRVPCKKALNGSYKTARYTLQVTELPNGTYYLKNKQTERYADVVLHSRGFRKGRLYEKNEQAEFDRSSVSLGGCGCGCCDCSCD